MGNIVNGWECAEGYAEVFEEDQKVIHYTIKGKKYPRIMYGFETGEFLRYTDTDELCNDCAADVGQYHAVGCDHEQCPKCHGQALGCDCDVKYCPDCPNCEK